MKSLSNTLSETFVSGCNNSVSDAISEVLTTKLNESNS